MSSPSSMHPTWKAFLRDWDQVLNDSPPVGLATTTKVYKAVMGQQEHDEMSHAEAAETLS